MMVKIMNRQQKISAFLFFIVILIATACLPTEEDFRAQSPLLGALESKSGLITYVGVDGNIYTINQAGGNEEAVTTDASDTRTYSLPAWSHDSEKLAFFAISNTEEDTVISSLHTAATDGSDMTELYASETNSLIYFNWAPDDKNISFLTSAPSGVLLHQVAVSGGDPQVLDAAPELYWDWAPDGRRLFLHSTGIESEVRLSFLTPREIVVEERMDIQPITFRAPAWSPDGQKLLLAVERESDDRALLLLDDKGQTQESLMPLQEGATAAAFSWAPNGERVAYISGEPVGESGTIILGALRTLDIENPNHIIKTESETVLAFFWSPDSNMIAYFVLSIAPASDSSDEPVPLISLHILDVDSGLSRQLTILQPTAEFLTIIPFFDQYSRSTTIWSPDSKNLVVTSYVDNNIPKVLVIPASGDLAPRLIGEGTLAIWSWE
jgi:TolB protein